MVISHQHHEIEHAVQDELDGWANGHAHLGSADGHFERHAGAALKQDDGNHGGRQVGLILQQ